MRLAVSRTLLSAAALTVATSCSSHTSTPQAQQTSSLSPSSTASASAPASARATAQASASPRSSIGASSAPHPSASASTTAAVPSPTSGSGGRTAAPGTYTYDDTGTVTFGSPGTPRDASGTATLTVSAPQATSQTQSEHSSDSDTVEVLDNRANGTYLTDLTIKTAAFNKEFRPGGAAIAFPNPPTVGASWSWSAKSTDGATTATTTGKLVRTETVTIGGQQVTTVVMQTHLVLSGDVDYTADVTDWVSTTYHLIVKDHQLGKGSYSGIPFSTDITEVMRSVRPS